MVRKEELVDKVELSFKKNPKRWFNLHLNVKKKCCAVASQFD